LSQARPPNSLRGRPTSLCDRGLDDTLAYHESAFWVGRGGGNVRCFVRWLQRSRSEQR
jgi:hypothetical protein